MPNTCSSSCLLCCICDGKGDQRNENESRRVETWQEIQSYIGSLPHLGVDVSAHGLWQPRRLVELSPPLLLWVSRHIRHQLREEEKRSAEARSETHFLTSSFLPPSQETLSCNLPLLASVHLGCALHVLKGFFLRRTCRLRIFLKKFERQL